MKKLQMLAVITLLATGAVEARTWGFDKDTVYESQPGGDTLWLINSGPDTLRIDSLFALTLDSLYWGDIGFLYRALEPSPFYYHTYSILQDGVQKIKMAGDAIPPGASIFIRSFNVQSAMLKSGHRLAIKDSLRVLLRFKSFSGEEDTVIVKGFEQISSSIHAYTPPAIIGKPYAARDLRGRTIKLRRNASPVLKH